MRENGPLTDVSAGEVVNDESKVGVAAECSQLARRLV